LAEVNRTNAPRRAARTAPRITPEAVPAGGAAGWETVTGALAWPVVILALAVIAAAEVTFVIGAVVIGAVAIGAVAYALVLVLFLLAYLTWTSEQARRLLLALTTVPIVRLLSLSVPTLLVPILDWYILIGVPAFLGILLVARTLRLRPVDLGLGRPRRIRPQVVVASSGLLLGLPAYLISRPDPMVAIPTPFLIVQAAVILAVFGGFLEELLYRGLIQSMASGMLARGGIIVSSATTAIMYASSLNVRYVLFMTLVAVFFGLAVRRTGSIVGTTGAHAILLITQLIVWPLAIG
jgi:membrane protease YdiL (CAAX protease family)